MRVFVTGATGVLGRRAVPALVRAGHLVTGWQPAMHAIEHWKDLTDLL